MFNQKLQIYPELLDERWERKRERESHTAPWHTWSLSPAAAPEPLSLEGYQVHHHVGGYDPIPPTPGLPHWGCGPTKQEYHVFLSADHGYGPFSLFSPNKPYSMHLYFPLCHRQKSVQKVTLRQEMFPQNAKRFVEGETLPETFWLPECIDTFRFRACRCVRTHVERRLSSLQMVQWWTDLRFLNGRSLLPCLKLFP